MLFQLSLLVAALVPSTLGCPQHTNNKRSHLQGRQTPSEPGNHTNKDWNYKDSFDWGHVNPAYHTCQMGTQQSPIALTRNNGLSLNHVPKFAYNGSTSGNFYNWGYGPAFTVAHDGDWTTHPSFTYDNETVYLKGWHIHTPADHLVDDFHSKAELHLVHVHEDGHEAAVLAIRLDPGNSNSTFFEQLPEMIHINEVDVEEPTTMDISLALESVLYFNGFWTYQGSLTSPPCKEGARWFVARQIMYTGVEQMQDILGVSAYSARITQPIWRHRINE